MTTTHVSASTISGTVAIYSAGRGHSIERDDSPEVRMVYTRPTGEGLSPAEVVILGHLRHWRAASEQEMAEDILSAMAQGDMEFFRQLDGSFSIIAICDGSLYLVTDKLATRPLWYAIDRGRVIASDNIRHVYRNMAEKPELDAVYLYSFVNYFRTVCDRTPFSTIRAIPAGRLVAIGKDLSIKTSIYWKPVFQPDRKRSLRDTAAELSDAVSQSVRRVLSDVARPALLLSGGLDSRLVAAHCPKNTTAITLGDSCNAEVRIAQRVAAACGIAHEVLLRHEDWYPQMLAKACAASNGISMWDHAHFLPMGEGESFTHDVVALAYGFDILFKGNSFSADTERRLARCAHNGLLDFIATAPPRSRATSAMLRRDRADSAYSAFRATVDCACEEIAECAEDMLDRYELFWVRNFYTMPACLNLICLRDFTSERNVTFSNAMLALYLSIPLSQRNTKGALIRKAIAHASPKVASIVDANTWLPASWHPYIHQLSARSRQRIARLRQVYLRWSGSRNAKSRGSWPHVARMWATNKQMISEMDALVARPDPRLEEYLDFTYISQHWADLKAGKPSDTSVESVVATIGLFLRACDGK